MSVPVVVGAGAVGTWLAVRIARHVDGTVLLSRGDVQDRVREEGPRVETLPGVAPDADGTLEAGAGLRVTADPATLPPDCLVFFAVRAYQTGEAARALWEAGVRPCGVVTLQNGLGNAEALAAVFSPQRVVAGATSHGVMMLRPGVVRHTGWGDTALGPWHPEAHGLALQAAGRLDSAGIGVHVVDDPRTVLWRKVAVNAAINPPTALHRIENGRLLDGGPLERDLRAAAREAARVAIAEGIRLDEQEAEALAVQVARRTARNRSSMLQAVEAGRPLEADAITGEVVRRATRHGIPVPVNERHKKALQAVHQTPRPKTA